MAVELPKFKQERLDETHELRMAMLNELREGGKFSTCPKEKAIAVKLLSDMDKQTLTIARLHADSENSEDDRKVALQIAELSKLSNANPFKREGGIPSAADAALPEVDLVDGELDEGMGIGSFDEFAKSNLDEDGKFIKT